MADVVDRLGRIDILVNDAAHQAVFDRIEDIPDAEWRRTFAVGIDAIFYLTKVAVPHMPRGGAIINTASINADKPNPQLLAYATTKGATQNFSTGLAQMLADRGIRVNTVAPGPVWTPLIPASMPPDRVAGRACPGLCDAGRTHVQLCFGCDRRRDRRQASDLTKGPAMTNRAVIFLCGLAAGFALKALQSASRRARTPAAPRIRAAGQREMQDPPRGWDIVDERGDESFPASDPPGGY